MLYAVSAVYFAGVMVRLRVANYLEASAAARPSPGAAPAAKGMTPKRSWSSMQRHLVLEERKAALIEEARRLVCVCVYTTHLSACHKPQVLHVMFVCLFWVFLFVCLFVVADAPSAAVMDDIAAKQRKIMPKKKVDKKKLRMAGGKVWRDETLCR